MNREMVGKLLERLLPYVEPGATVAVLGLAYKPFSHVIEESQGVHLARALSDAGSRVVGFDPLAGDEARRVLRDHAVILQDIGSCLAQADAAVVTTPDPVFRALQAADFLQKNPPMVVFDCWRVLREELSKCNHVRYVPFGIGSHEPELVSQLEEMWGEVKEARS
jgi:UDPglucose 6-dehydrogenase